MNEIRVDSSCAITFVPGGVADVNAPTSAELARGVDLTDCVILDEPWIHGDVWARATVIEGEIVDGPHDEARTERA